MRSICCIYSLSFHMRLISLFTLIFSEFFFLSSTFKFAVSSCLFVCFRSFVCERICNARVYTCIVEYDSSLLLLYEYVLRFTTYDFSSVLENVRVFACVCVCVHCQRLPTYFFCEMCWKLTHIHKHISMWARFRNHAHVLTMCWFDYTARWNLILTILLCRCNDTIMKIFTQYVGIVKDNKHTHTNKLFISYDFSWLRFFHFYFSAVKNLCFEFELIWLSHFLAVIDWR